VSLSRDPQIGFETRLRHVAGAGISLPPEIEQLRERLKAFQRASDGNPMRDRLAAAIVTDDPEADRELLWACALAEASASPPLIADLRDFVRLRINRRIREVYSDIAGPTYVAIGAQFDKAAATLTNAATLVDTEAPAEAVVDANDKQRRAWKDAATAAAELGRLLLPLKAAAVLAGICDDDADNDLPLCIDPGELHRREVWSAWETEQREAKAERTAANSLPFTTNQPAARSRTGRWGALIRLGATVRACPPDSFAPYRRPARLEERTVTIDGRNQRITVDTEHPDYEPPQPVTFAAPRLRVGH
jgi:hypothetical protein